MIDLNTRLKNRINNTHDLRKLWDKLRKEGMQVYEAEDYENGEQAPYHMMIIDKGNGAPVEVLYRNKTPEELAEDEELGITPFLQQIEWVKY